MKGELHLDGVPVHCSWLSHRAYRAAPCSLLLPITPENRAEMLAEFRREKEFGKYSGLRISGIADPDFLEEFPKLLYLELVDQKKVNTRRLEGLANLRGLHLETPGAGIDFSWFPELERFVGDWHADNLHLGRADELRELRIRHFKPRSENLTELAGAVRLERLHLTQTGITDLAGIETLEDLHELDIAYAPKLASLAALAGSESGIRELSLGKAMKIDSYQPLASLRHLRRLRLSGCAPMPDLAWTRGMDRLDFFSFVETNVADGDLSPLLELPNLRYVGTMDKKHYSHKFEVLNRLLETKRSG